MLLSELRPLIRLQVPGCPDPVIDMMVIEATRQLCRVTHIWRYELDALELDRDDDNVTLTPPEDSEILTVFSVEYDDDGALIPRTTRQLTRETAAWREDVGNPSYFVYTPPATIRLVPLPSPLRLSELIVTVSLMPAVGSTAIDDRIATPYSEIIRTAAIGELMLVPNRPWTNAQLGAAYVQTVAAATANIVEEGTDNGLRNLPRRVRYGGY